MLHIIVVVLGGWDLRTVTEPFAGRGRGGTARVKSAQVPTHVQLKGMVAPKKLSSFPVFGSPGSA